MADLREEERGGEGQQELRELQETTTGATDGGQSSTEYDARQDGNSQEPSVPADQPHEDVRLLSGLSAARAASNESNLHPPILRDPPHTPHFRINPLLVPPRRGHPPFQLNPPRSHQEPSSNPEQVPEHDEAPTEPEPEYFPKTFRDIDEVVGIISGLLLPELASPILEMAEYWVREREERNTQLMTREADVMKVYITTSPIGRASAWTVAAKEAETNDQGKAATQNHKSGPVKKVIFTLRSHDQGYSSYPNDQGTYRNSWTWFEASVGDPALTDSEPPKEAQTGEDTEPAAPSSSEQTPAPPTQTAPTTNPPPQAQPGPPAMFRPGRRAMHRPPHGPPINLAHAMFTPSAPVKRRSPSQDQRQRRRRLVTNIHASQHDVKHTVTWCASADSTTDPDDVKLWETEIRPRDRGDNEAAEAQTIPQADAKTRQDREEEAQWVRALQPGEVINVEAWALYPGWCNHVGGATVDVFLGL